MFPGMFIRKPDKAAALKQLKSHVAVFGLWVTVIRVTPYILNYFYDQNEELKLELNYTDLDSGAQSNKYISLESLAMKKPKDFEFLLMCGIPRLST